MGRTVGLLKSFLEEWLYSKLNKLPLSYSELTEEAKVAKARFHTTFEESEDPCVKVKGALLNIDGGRKANTHRSVNQARRDFVCKKLQGFPM